MQILLDRLPSIVSTALVVGLAALCYWQINPLLLPVDNKINTLAASSPVTQKSSQEKIHNIEKFYLFGKLNSKPKIVETEQKDLPKTRLRLTLTGIVAGQGKITPSALIEGPDKQTLLYKIGDDIPGNATLNNIYSDRVVLNRSGRLENLLFPEVSTGGAQYLAAQVPLLSIPSSKTAPPVKRPNYGGQALPSARKQSIKDRLSTIRNRIKNDRK